MKKKTKDLKFDSSGKPIADRFGGYLLKDKFQPPKKKRKMRFKKDKSGNSSITDV